MERDGWACQLCGGAVSDGGLHVHHIIPYRETQDNSPENLIALCPRCHCWADHHLDESVPMLDAIISAIYDL
jgi:5-methylcytosine-specific restriction endonuclease McrA